MNYLPFISWGVFGARTAAERANCFVSRGLLFSFSALANKIYKNLIIIFNPNTGLPVITRRIMLRINENTALTLTISFADDTGAEIIPATAEYRLDDVSSGAEILTWTSITPSTAALDIIITEAQNAILDSTREREKKRLTARFTYGADNKQATAEYIYAVRNLTKI
jgi:hypothetical protein